MSWGNQTVPRLPVEVPLVETFWRFLRVRKLEYGLEALDFANVNLSPQMMMFKSWELAVCVCVCVCVLRLFSFGVSCRPVWKGTYVVPSTFFGYDVAKVLGQDSFWF